MAQKLNRNWYNSRARSRGLKRTTDYFQNKAKKIILNPLSHKSLNPVYYSQIKDHYSTKWRTLIHVSL